MTLPGAAVVWGGGAILHATGVPWLDVGLAGITGAGVTYGAVLHRSRKKHGQHPDDAAWRAAKAAIGVGIAGTWSAAAARWGLFAGPYDLSSIMWGSTALLGYGIVRADEINRRNRDWRNEKANWHTLAPTFGLGGSHLIDSEKTRLGRRLTVDTKGTGKRASQLASRDVGERIAEHYMLPAVRVQVTPAKIAGRLHISIRLRDPWAHPILHPMLDDVPEIELAARQSVRDPLIVGMDPDTGKPLELRMWDDEYGARGLLIVSMTGGGKTVLLNDIMERLTACDDVLVWDINLSKAKENRRWAPACDLTAHGPHEKTKALQILRLALKVIEWRGNNDDSDDAIHHPDAEDPLIVLRFDELDAGQGGSDGLSQAMREIVNTINSKKRSEGMGLIQASQRGTSSYGTTTDIRANFSNYAVAQVRNRTEAMYAAGDAALYLPDMSEYGEGNPGVWAIGGMGGDFETGRTFYLKHLNDLSKIADDRKPRATLPVPLRDHLGDAYVRLKTGTVPAYSVEADQLPDWMKDIEKDLESDMGSDLLGQMDQMDRTRAKTDETGRALDTLAAEDMPEVPPENAAMVAAAKAERRRQAAMSVDIPDAHRSRLLTILRGGEAATGDLAAALQVSKATLWRYLDRLRTEGAVECRGKGRGSRWIASAEAPREHSG